MFKVTNLGLPPPPPPPPKVKSVECGHFVSFNQRVVFLVLRQNKQIINNKCSC